MEVNKLQAKWRDSTNVKKMFEEKEQREVKPNVNNCLVIQITYYHYNDGMVEPVPRSTEAVLVSLQRFMLVFTFICHPSLVS